MLCSDKGSVHDLSKIFMPKVEGKFHATKSKGYRDKHHSFKTLKNKTFLKNTFRSGISLSINPSHSSELLKTPYTAAVISGS
jgi:hypothetical protein